MISDVTTAGAMPTLEAMFRFAGARQQLIANNVANIDTPNYRHRDVDPRAFQAQLAEAVQARRGRTGGTHGALAWESTRHVERLGPDGSLRLHPREGSGNVLFHDRNDRDLERTMQDLVENAGVYRVAADLLRKQMTQIRGALRERLS